LQWHATAVHIQRRSFSVNNQEDAQLFRQTACFARQNSIFATQSYGPASETFSHLRYDYFQDHHEILYRMVRTPQPALAQIQPREIELAILRKDLHAVHLHLSGDRVVEVSLRDWPRFLLAMERPR
jgi:hypothetical protein